MVRKNVGGYCAGNVNEESAFAFHVGRHSSNKGPLNILLGRTKSVRSDTIGEMKNLTVTNKCEDWITRFEWYANRHSQQSTRTSGAGPIFI